MSPIFSPLSRMKDVHVIDAFFATNEKKLIYRHILRDEDEMLLLIEKK